MLIFYSEVFTALKCSFFYYKLFQWVYMRNKYILRQSFNVLWQSFYSSQENRGVPNQLAGSPKIQLIVAGTVELKDIRQ